MCLFHFFPMEGTTISALQSISFRHIPGPQMQLATIEMEFDKSLIQLMHLATHCMVHTRFFQPNVCKQQCVYLFKISKPSLLSVQHHRASASPHDRKPWGTAANSKASDGCLIPTSSLCSQSRETNLDKRMVEELAGCPPHLWVTFQAVAKEVFPFWTHFVRNWRFMTHPHSVHDLEVVLIFVPRPLQQETELLSARFRE